MAQGPAEVDRDIVIAALRAQIAAHEAEVLSVEEPSPLAKRAPPPFAVQRYALDPCDATMRIPRRGGHVLGNAETELEYGCREDDFPIEVTNV